MPVHPEWTVATTERTKVLLSRKGRTHTPQSTASPEPTAEQGDAMAVQPRWGLLPRDGDVLAHDLPLLVPLFPVQIFTSLLISAVTGHLGVY